MGGEGRGGEGRGGEGREGEHRTQKSIKLLLGFLQERLKWHIKR